MSKKETSFEKAFDLPNPGLRSYFDRVRNGNPDEYRTPFYKGTSLENIVGDWVKQSLIKIRDQWPSLWDFEMDLAKKVGPMSIMKPLSERMDDIDSYYSSILLEAEPISDQAVQRTAWEWRKLSGLRVRSQPRTIDVMKKSTNSGAPYFTKRRSVIHKTFPCWVVPQGTYVKQFLNGKEWLAPAILGWRGQEGGLDFDDVKQRVVWMFPFAVNIKELQVYQPLIEGAQRLNLVPAWVSMDAVDERITQMFDTKGKDDLVVCTDFSKFDQHFNAKMQDAAYQLLKKILAPFGDAKDWLTNVFPIKYMIPLAYDWGKIRVGSHGMGSGSGGTNADETLAHRALQHEAAANARKELNPNSQCLGDDGVLTYPGITVEDVVRSYTSHGLEMNESKQYASKQDCVYLRRWHHTDYRVKDVCVGVYSTCRALGRLAEQERYYDPDIWSKEMVALRELSIIENVKWHPLFEEFVQYCIKGDKYRLGLDIPGFLDHIDRYAKEATDLMPDFLGYTKSMGKDAEVGIRSWRVVQYLRSKMR